MITIVKGSEKIVCSYGTYEEQYKNLGYALESKIEDKKTQKTQKISIKNKIDEEEIADIERISTKYGTKKKSTTKKGEE